MQPTPGGWHRLCHAARLPAPLPRLQDDAAGLATKLAVMQGQLDRMEALLQQALGPAAAAASASAAPPRAAPFATPAAVDSVSATVE